MHLLFDKVWKLFKKVLCKLRKEGKVADVFCASSAPFPPINNAALSAGQVVKQLEPRRKEVAVGHIFEYAHGVRCSFYF